MPQSPESFTFTVGKLDAGMAILLGERAHLIEFPSLLLPPGATTGSIVNISVQRNTVEEKKRDSEFWGLQNDLLQMYGTRSPEPPKLELRNVTQTSVTLEWPSLQLATAKLRSLDIYRNRQRLASIPNPLTNTSTKLSGLQIDTDYDFQLILRTTAGVYPSNVLKVRTHTMANTSGISVCFGNVQDPVLLENAKMALREMGAKWSEKIQIDTTHFVCTTPAATPSGAAVAGNLTTAPGVEYQKALQLSIPVVQPHWILACHSAKKMVPIHPYYLGANPPTPTGFSRPQSMSQANLSREAHSASPTAQKHVANRQSMPPQRVSSGPPTSPPTPAKRFAPTPEEREHEHESGREREAHQGHVRKGTMSKTFKFPPPAPEPEPPVPSPPEEETSPTPPQGQAEGQNEGKNAKAEETEAKAEETEAEEAGLTTVGVVAPSSVEVPPPPPVEKELPPSSVPDPNDDDLGETEEISLN